MKFCDDSQKMEYRRVFFILFPFLVLSVHLSVMALTFPESDFIIMTGLMLGYILPPAGKETIIPLQGKWESTFVPTMDNRWGDFRIPASGEFIGPEEADRDRKAIIAASMGKL